MQFSDMYGETAEYYPDAGLTPAKAKEFVNRAYLEIASAFQFYELDFDTTTDTVVDQNYVNKPTGARDIITVYDEDDKVPLKPESIEWYESQDNSTGNTGVPEYFIHFGSKLLLFPTPNAIHTLRIRYKKLPSELSADGDEPVFPDEWHPAIVLSAASKAGFYLGFDSKAINLKNEFLGLLSSLQEDTTRASRRRVGQVTVQRTRGSHRLRGRANHAEFL